MHEINTRLSSLQRDHDQIQKLLNTLELEFMNLCRDTATDFSIMLSIAVYIRDVPEQTHHPMEDAMLSVLIKKGGKIAKLGRQVVTDHTELESMTRNLISCLESLQKDSASQQVLKRLLSEFLVRQRRHFYIEEMDVYPLFQRLLTREDWMAVKNMVPELNESMPGEAASSGHELLSRLRSGNSE